jgi:proteic killer suppression protein
VIRSFADAATERLFETGSSRRLPPDILKRAMMRLLQLHAATSLEDIRLPVSNRLEPLRGDRAGRYSIRVNDQWRVCFRLVGGDAWDVEIVDYH